MAALTVDPIKAVALDSQNRGLAVYPAVEVSAGYSFIWRAASGVRWDSSERALFAAEPKRWEPEELFRQMLVSVAGEYGHQLRLCEDTNWALPDIALKERLEAASREFSETSSRSGNVA